MLNFLFDFYVLSSHIQEITQNINFKPQICTYMYEKVSVDVGSFHLELNVDRKNRNKMETNLFSKGPFKLHFSFEDFPPIPAFKF